MLLAIHKWVPFGTRLTMNRGILLKCLRETNMINRFWDKKRKVLNIFLEHAIHEAELLDIDPDLTDLGSWPSTYRSCDSDEDITEETEFEEWRGLEDEESGEKEKDAEVEVGGVIKIMRVRGGRAV